MINPFHPVLTTLDTPQDLFQQAKTMHRTYLRFGSYWSVETCLEGIIKKRQITDKSLITSSIAFAKDEDKRFERIMSL